MGAVNPGQVMSCAPPASAAVRLPSSYGRRALRPHRCFRPARRHMSAPRRYPRFRRVRSWRCGLVKRRGPRRVLPRLPRRSCAFRPPGVRARMLPAARGLPPCRRPSRRRSAGQPPGRGPSRHSTWSSCLSFIAYLLLLPLLLAPAGARQTVRRLAGRPCCTRHPSCRTCLPRPGRSPGGVLVCTGCAPRRPSPQCRHAGRVRAGLIRRGSGKPRLV
jgi:hypothetical protein